MTNAIFIAIVVLIVLRFVAKRVPTDAYIVDGDTIRVDGVSWRLSGFDAPESNQPGGSDATAKLRGIIAGEKTWVILRNPDVYGRPLATIYTRSGPLSWRMIVTGHAHGEGLIGGILTMVAHTFRRGMWAHDDAISPRIWREKHPQRRGAPGVHIGPAGTKGGRARGKRRAKASDHMRVMDADGTIETDYRPSGNRNLTDWTL